MTITLMAGAAIDKGITSIINRSGKLGPDIHKYAVQALLHAREHNDPRKLDRLLKGLHKSNRPTALKAWAEKYSPVRWNGDDKVGILKETAKSYVPWDVEGADADPYWNKPEAKTTPLTLAMLRAMIAKMEKKLDKDDVEIAEGENVVAMKAYVARMKAADEAAAKECESVGSATVINGAATQPRRIDDPNKAAEVSEAA